MKKKLENFLYYYKFHLIAALFLLILVIVLVKDDKPRMTTRLVVADDTSQMNLQTAGSMMDEFAEYAGLEKGEAVFYYQSMFLDQKNFENINLNVAGVADYEGCFQNGEIDCVINTIDRVKSAEQNGAADSEETGDFGQTEGEGDETEEVSLGLHAVVSLNQIFSEDELNRYEKYICYVNGEPAGIMFDMCKKAKEYFGDDYPSANHYVLQVAEGSADKELVKEFLEYLIQ